eukprot:scaffold7963_cov116-Isochrysis_galbana.AAC.12
MCNGQSGGRAHVQRAVATDPGLAGRDRRRLATPKRANHARRRSQCGGLHWVFSHAATREWRHIPARRPFATGRTVSLRPVAAASPRRCGPRTPRCPPSAEKWCRLPPPARPAAGSQARH